jgi:hypothetical protein
MEGVSRAVAPPGTEEPPGASVSPGRPAGDAGREGALVPAVTRLNNVSFEYGDGLEVFRDLERGAGTGGGVDCH